MTIFLLGFRTKTIGIFNSKIHGSRSIEDCIDGRTLTPEDAVDPLIRSVFVNKLAKIHSMKGLPLEGHIGELSDQNKKLTLKFDTMEETFSGTKFLRTPIKMIST